MSTSFLTSAIAYAERGWRVFPCIKKAKTPYIAHWPDRATSDPEQIREFWDIFPEANVGLVTGRTSGIFVVDIDGEEGDKSLLSIQQASYIPDTLRVKTARGWHLFFQYPPTGEVRNSAGQLGTGLDVRGEGGYVIAPPSVHPSGHVYTFAKSDESVAEAPDWLLSRITVGPAACDPTFGDSTPAIVCGTRNATLTTIAGSLRRHGIGEESILATLLRENESRCQPPLSPDEVERIAKSVSRYRPSSQRGPGRLTLVRAADVKPEDPKWLVEPYIPADRLVLLCGDPGVGKSYLALSIAADVTRGVCPITGEPVREPRPTLYLSNEDSAGDLRRRFDRLRGDPKLLFLESVEGQQYWLSNQAALEAAVAEYKPALVVVDTVSSHFGVSNDSHKSNEVSALLTPLSRLAEQYSVAIVGLLHLSKGQQTNSLYKVNGSIGFVGTARSVLLCGPDPDDPTQCAMVHRKSNTAQLGLSRLYRIDDDGFRWLGTCNISAGDLVAPETTSDERSAVEEAIALISGRLEGGPQSAKELLEAALQIGIAEKTFRRASRRLDIVKRPAGFGGAWTWELRGWQSGPNPEELATATS